MPAITAIAVSAGTPLVRALAALGARVKQFARRVRNRRDAIRLAELDPHMLADIGLTRSDLRDAYSEPLWRDPTDVLASRAAERRVGRRRPTRHAVTHTLPSLFAAQPKHCYPRLDRSCRFLV